MGEGERRREGSRRDYGTSKGRLVGANVKRNGGQQPGGGNVELTVRLHSMRAGAVAGASETGTQACVNVRCARGREAAAVASGGSCCGLLQSVRARWCLYGRMLAVRQG